jgi:hypothetical protein
MEVLKDALIRCAVAGFRASKLSAERASNRIGDGGLRVLGW